VLVATSKNPTTTSLARVVRSEGAATTELFGENAPLCESTGFDRSRPLKSRIAPAAVDVDDHDQR
jgi:hypothetical protein